MPTVMVTYEVSGIPVGTGAMPCDPNTPIDSPEDCFLVTNQRSVFAAGSHCFTLLSADDFSPLWIPLDLNEGDDLSIAFHRLTAGS